MAGSLHSPSAVHPCGGIRAERAVVVQYATLRTSRCAYTARGQSHLKFNVCESELNELREEGAEEQLHFLADADPANPKRHQMRPVSTEEEQMQELIKKGVTHSSVSISLSAGCVEALSPEAPGRYAAEVAAVVLDLLLIVSVCACMHRFGMFAVQSRSTRHK